MSLSTNYPTIRPSLLLDFANTQALDPRVTFTRSTTGTYYDGKTSAIAEQNLWIQSQAFTNIIYVTRAGTTTVTSTAPDGTSTAGLYIENTANALHGIGSDNGTFASVSANTVYTYSVYIAPYSGTRNLFIGVGPSGGGRACGIVLNSSLTFLNTFTQGTSYTVIGQSITLATNGFYRVSFTFTNSNTADTTAYMFLYTAPSGTTTFPQGSYTGDGTSGFYLWGAQLEQRSSATAYNATTTTAITNYIPVLQTAAANVPRFDCDPVSEQCLGLLIEQQSTNICLYSSAYDNAAWVKQNLNITTAADIAPDGTQTAELAYATSTNATHATYTANFSASASTSYTASVYAKAQGLNFLCMRFDDQSTNLVSSCFNLSTGTISTAAAGLGTFTNLSSAITSVGNGWYRCSITATTASTTNILRVVLFVNNVTSDYNGAAYAGNGYSGIYMWGTQLEALSFPTSYIPTTTAAVTRVADSVSMTGTNFSSWYNPNQGTLYSEVILGSSVADKYIAQISDNTTSNRILLAGTTNPYEAIVINNSIVVALNASGNFYSGTYKVSCFYAVNNFGIASGGSIPTTSLSGNLPSVNRIDIGGFYGTYLNGRIKKIAYYPEALSSTNLQALTGS